MYRTHLLAQDLMQYHHIAPASEKPVTIDKCSGKGSTPFYLCIEYFPEVCSGEDHALQKKKRYSDII